LYTEPSSERDGLYPIGRLSKAVGVSVDTLRYYDEIGLLKPAYTSGETGYRYYSTEQSALMAQILELKAYGFSLAEIKAITACNQPSSRLTEVYQNRYWELLQEKKRLQTVIDKISEKIKWEQERFYMGKKILLVDDAAFMRMMCRDILTKNGFEIAGEAANGLEAVEMYQKYSPDLVLMDIVMPLCDGIFAMQKIKEQDANANVVMLSAMGQMQMVVESLLSGANGFVVKPFGADKMLEEVRNALTRMKIYDKTKLEKIRAGIVNTPDPDGDTRSQSDTDESKKTQSGGGNISSPGGEILSQQQIDEIITAAQIGAADGALAEIIQKIKEQWRQFKSGAGDHPRTAPAVGAAADPSHNPPQTDQMLLVTMLGQLIRGQEETLKLLRDVAGYIKENTDAAATVNSMQD
jgi:two-component system chemotaxis response regulator CheY